MKIWHISDTHTYHDLLRIPEGVDMVIHSGDCSNPRDPYNNEPEVREFIDWYKELPIKNKIYVPGNHDTSIEKKLVIKKDFTDAGIVYLEDILPETALVKLGWVLAHREWRGSVATKTKMLENVSGEFNPRLREEFLN